MHYRHKHVRGARFTSTVSVKQGPLIAYLGDKAYGYTASRETLLVGRGWNPQDTRAHVHREISPALAVGHSWNHGTMEPPFFEPGEHQTTAPPMLLFVHAHTLTSIRQRASWARLHDRRSLFIRPPLPPPHASGRPVTRPDHDVSILILKYQPDGGPLVAVQCWLWGIPV